MSLTMKRIRSSALVMPMIFFLAACTHMQGAGPDTSAMAGKHACCERMASQGETCCPMTASSGEKKGCCCDGCGKEGAAMGTMCKPAKE